MIENELNDLLNKELLATCTAEHEIFNSEITSDETMQVLKNLQNKKGVWPDGICNEVLKSGRQFLCTLLTKPLTS